MPQPQLERNNYNYGDYLTWPEEERWEIIDGVPHMMAPPSRIHQEILTELLTQFSTYLREKPCRVYPAPFGVRFPIGNETSDQEITTVVEPDITVVCDQSKLDDHGCKGTPDLIVEIVSPSSVKNDMLKKFNLYEKAGVKEYWIVEPNGKIVTVFILGDNDRYGRQEVYSEDDEIQVGVFNNLKINLKAVFAY
jgi:Uma2 family endonuclease